MLGCEVGSTGSGQNPTSKEMNSRILKKKNVYFAISWGLQIPQETYFCTE
jgi:hypothetical protein